MRSESTRVPIGRHMLSGDETVADDLAMNLLDDLDEVLWVYRETERLDGHDFGSAVRRRDHVAELRRLLYRLHRLLVEWEECESADPVGRPR